MLLASSLLPAARPARLILRGATTIPRRCQGNGYRLARPDNEFLIVLKRICRYLIIRHADIGSIRIRAKLPHAARLVVGTVRIVDLEVEHVVGDEAKEQAIEIQTHTPEHAQRRDLAQTGEL